MHWRHSVHGVLVVAIVVAGVAIVIGTQGVSAAPRGAGSSLATYFERAPQLASSPYYQVTGVVQGQVEGAPQAPAAVSGPPLPPLPASSFRAPIAAYLAFSVSRLGLMEGRISQMEGALGAGDRRQAKAAWRAAFADYLELGAVYLDQPLASLNNEIDGMPGGLPGGTASPRFSGLHRLEFGLWTGRSLSSLEPWARRLATNVDTLRRELPSVQILPLDYATRAHEILEDAVRDLLSGDDVPWSGEGVLGTAAGVVATNEVLATLSPLLRQREGVLPVVDTEMGALRAVLGSMMREHDGTLPTNGELTQIESERLDASVGEALEALAQVPGVLETSTTPKIPEIPPSAVKIDP